MILRMVVRARRGDALRPWGVSEMSIEALPWPVWVRSLVWEEDGVDERTVRNTRQSASCRRPAATKRTPLGALSPCCNVGVTSKSNKGGRSVATELESPAKVMKLKRGATRLTIWSCGRVSESCKVRGHLHGPDSR